MSSASLVPETSGLSGDDAWETLRVTGRRRLLADAFMRLRVADGFSHVRSLAFMTSLVIVQGTIAVVGLAGAIGGSGFSDIVAATIRRTVPGPAGAVLMDTVNRAHDNGTHHRLAPVIVGVVGCLVSSTTAFGQIERGLNRIYGVEVDRPMVKKYGRALVLALTAGLLASSAFVCLAFGRNLVRPVTKGHLSTVWNFACWPLGLLLLAGCVTVLFQAGPRRTQPNLSWLAFGAGVAVALLVIVTAGLGEFFRTSHSFGEAYGPLAGVVALLLWALLSAVALFYGAAVAAQLESVRKGEDEPQDAEKVAHAEPIDDPDLAPSADATPALSSR